MLAPIFPVFLVMKESILIEASRTFVIPLKQLKDLQCQVGQYVRTDLGLESHCQLTLTIILVLLASSMTRTIVGFEVMFEKETVALACSIAWSIVSTISSFFKGISKKRKHSSSASNAIVLLYAVISIFVRTFTIVLFWTPCLGLMNCLRHLQGEMYPFYNPYYGYANANDTFHFGDADSIPWNNITRWTYTAKNQALPPKHTLYTMFTIEQYFVGFMIALTTNVIMQTVAKKWTNPDVYGNASWIDLGIHSISTTFIPQPLKEWDEEDGSVASHRKRKDMVLTEMLTSILLNFGFNILFLTPIIILGNKFLKKYNIDEVWHLIYNFSCSHPCLWKALNTPKLYRSVSRGIASVWSGQVDVDHWFLPFGITHNLSTGLVLLVQWKVPSLQQDCATKQEM